MQYLVAGNSTRCALFTYECLNGLFRVKGAFHIWRKIDQLIEVGV